MTEPEPPSGEELPPGQKAFDDAIAKGGKATARVGNGKVTIDRVQPVENGSATSRPPSRTATS